MKSKKIARRDFLKVLGASSLFYPASKLMNYFNLDDRRTENANQPNFLIILFDAFTAQHISLHGYKRNTTPNIDKFAKKSTVYHRHYSSSSHTKPSTSSLLTGVYPWSHRAFMYYTSMIEIYRQANLFSKMPAEYYNLTYTHNTFVTGILEEFRSDIDLMEPMEDLSLYNPNKFQNIFKNDAPMGFYASKRWRDDYIGPSASLFINPISSVINGLESNDVQKKNKDLYPLGLSDNQEGYLYKLEEAIDWIGESTRTIRSPFLSYFHLLPPHEAYKPRADFLGLFRNDGVRLTKKPPHFFTENQTQEQLEQQCQLYDEYIALVDSEFGRLYQQLEKSGVLDSAYLILTSDHGQGFERGIHGHGQPVLYETNIHIPLMIHAPGQDLGRDIFTPTSITDITPTIIHLASQKTPEWCEGKLLPALGGVEDSERVIFAVEAKSNYKLKPIAKATFSAIQGRYKLITYKGYEGFDKVDELYDLENDPEELRNLANEKSSIVAMLKEELQRNQTTAEKKSIGI